MFSTLNVTTTEVLLSNKQSTRIINIGSQMSAKSHNTQIHKRNTVQNLLFLKSVENYTLNDRQRPIKYLTFVAMDCLCFRVTF